MAEILLLAHLAATMIMVGIIWFVQLVHNPLFGSVGAHGFPAYSEAHSRLMTGYVVGPPMLTEAATAIPLVFFRPAGVPEYLTWTGPVLLAVV